jgi:hypothetical protein
MIRRTLIFLGVLASLATLARPVLASDTVLAVTIDGRPLSSVTKSGGYLLHGVPFVNAVAFVKAFNGLVVFGTTDSERKSIDITLQRATAEFAVGVGSYSVKNGPTVPMAGATFLSNGDFYIPVAALAKLAGATFTRHGTTVAVKSPDASVSLASPAPSATPNPAEDEPTPAQALSVMPSATIDDAGLHLKVNVANTTSAPYVVNFPSGAQIAFVVTRNGNLAYDSLAGKTIVTTPTTLTFAPNETKTFSGLWPGYASAGAGRYTLRVRLMTTQPLDFPPVSIGVASPAPAAS